MKIRLFNGLLIAAGGGFGSLVRYVVSFIHPFSPYSTIIVNLAGSFLLGFITMYFMQNQGKEWLKYLLGTGFCGGFTTMSAFSLELTQLSIEKMMFYMVCSIFFGMLLVLAGMKLAKVLSKRESKSW